MMRRAFPAFRQARACKPWCCMLDSTGPPGRPGPFAACCCTGASSARRSGESRPPPPPAEPGHAGRAAAGVRCSAGAGMGPAATAGPGARGDRLPRAWCLSRMAAWTAALEWRRACRRVAAAAAAAQPGSRRQLCSGPRALGAQGQQQQGPLGLQAPCCSPELASSVWPDRPAGARRGQRRLPAGCHAPGAAKEEGVGPVERASRRTPSRGLALRGPGCCSRRQAVQWAIKCGETGRRGSNADRVESWRRNAPAAARPRRPPAVIGQAVHRTRS